MKLLFKQTYNIQLYMQSYVCDFSSLNFNSTNMATHNTVGLQKNV